jgi:hypothetical protein
MKVKFESISIHVLVFSLLIQLILVMTFGDFNLFEIILIALAYKLLDLISMLHLISVLEFICKYCFYNLKIMDPSLIVILY